MSDFEYRLAVLTHGRMATLDESLDAFFECVEPRPAQVLVHADGVPADLRRELARRCSGAQLRAGPARQGFCVATAALWAWASEPVGPRYVFWLEHDFLVRRPVDLRHLAVALDGDRRLAQMALIRNPANEQETAAGGLVASRPGEFFPQQDVAGPWLAHRSYWTTNPSLMRREFMAANPWPRDGVPYCEGRYGIELVRRGYHFGAWGSGEEWVEHVGVRTGHGY